MTGNSTMTKKSQGLTAIQLKAIDLLVSGMPAVAVAEKINVHPSTISVWKRDSQFESCMNVLLRQARDDCREKLRALGHDALETIQKIMNDDKTPSKERLTAALKIVEMLKIETSATGGIGSIRCNSVHIVYIVCNVYNVWIVYSVYNVSCVYNVGLLQKSFSAVLSCP